MVSTHGSNGFWGNCFRVLTYRVFRCVVFFNYFFSFSVVFLIGFSFRFFFIIFEVCLCVSYYYFIILINLKFFFHLLNFLEFFVRSINLNKYNIINSFLEIKLIFLIFNFPWSDLNILHVKFFSTIEYRITLSSPLLYIRATNIKKLQFASSELTNPTLIHKVDNKVSSLLYTLRFLFFSFFFFPLFHVRISEQKRNEHTDCTRFHSKD